MRKVRACRPRRTQANRVTIGRASRSSGAPIWRPVSNRESRCWPGFPPTWIPGSTICEGLVVVTDRRLLHGEPEPGNGRPATRRWHSWPLPAGAPPEGARPIGGRHPGTGRSARDVWPSGATRSAGARRRPVGRALRRLPPIRTNPPRPAIPSPRSALLAVPICRSKGRTARSACRRRSPSRRHRSCVCSGSPGPARGDLSWVSSSPWRARPWA